jgi:CBS domain-containing protein
MTSDVQVVKPEQTIREAAGFMLSADAGSIPVCDGERLQGMITDRTSPSARSPKDSGPTPRSRRS